LSKIGLTTTLKNAWATSRQVNFFWVANFNLKFGKIKRYRDCSYFINVFYTKLFLGPIFRI
ncbi:hypothetical protein, partial [Streptococcus pneumoniae]|uniref:hypothetical protein n=1 Tax=Streptococcus pneumoniae TaxID=1313 RepID=UPI001C71EA9A